MRKQQDMMGKGRWLGLLGVSTFVLLAGCGWFGGRAPGHSARVRPGADRQAVASGALPSANPGRQHEQGVAAADETRGSTPQIGSVVAARGGQKAQREVAEKEANARDAKEREARVASEAAEREARAKEAPEKTTRKTSNSTLPGKPAAAQSATAEPATTPAA